ncbi:MAG TPA: metalloregulator ArsR/SmtB family transcription factor [Leptospiraceae bacterium]|nr:metalloregulator ArsR/SmtB family transcription factor [Leptospiraceae bacterium]HMW08407.1 metalloregulator ArsR/SmtB family transcription factor [Leptospiraceae bacterium]HMX33689.1 metalloregulator ArsR/SmtB family transcription factor [Leptospiraceae bacterium]HMY34096.1 metalloregulator ArsR/SmtB family transcription factor [Leptospiraceae bacterium]HMZ65960.1 metalloregulator ArsR/SmtB family transcription factor [Leptospiraceae bacterium]
MNVFSALADTTRRDIVVLLARKGELSMSDISKNFTMTPPAISQHLKILKEAKVIQVKKEAQLRLYSIDQSGLDEMDEWISEVRNLWTKRFNSLGNYLEKLKKERGIGKKSR